MNVKAAGVVAFVILSAAVHGQPHGITPSEYRARRAAVAKAIGPNGVFIAFSPAAARRTGDVDWPFRQEDNLLYLTGMDVADTTLVLLPGEAAHQELLFTTDRNPSQERWTGRVLSYDEVTARSGVHEVFSARRVDALIDALFQGNGFDPTPASRSGSGYYATPFAPSILSAFRAGRVEVWLLLGDR